MVKLIPKATLENVPRLVSLEIQMWKSHTVEDLTKNFSLKFHLKMGFAEANRIICFTKRLTDLEE